MKKNFKFMLVALLAFLGFNSAFAQAVVGDVFESGNYKFSITKTANAQGNGGTVQILGLTDAAKVNKNTNGDETYIAFSGSGESKKGVLEFPATATNAGVTYTVTTMADVTFKDVAYYATEVTIPAALTEIPVAAFNTLTNLKKIEFASGSQVKKIGAQAFASTRITEFDFTNCEELEGLGDEVFVERSDVDPNPNVNSYITKVTVPTSPKFKHINGAFRNLTELTEIDGLANSWVMEIGPSAFQNTKVGTSEEKPLILPEKNLLYIDKNALAGSEVAYLEIKMGSVLYVGGCTVTWEQDENPESDNYGEYTYNYTVEGSETNLYGLDAEDAAEDEIAPLVSLSLTGTQRGKICTNAFLACEDLDGLDLRELNYGSKAQFETSSFEGCTGITELYINPLANNETEGYTFEEEAFKDCPIETLTMVSVNTAKAVNTKAFGDDLKTVTIGTVDATGAEEAPAFAEGAFTFGVVSGATLSLAAGENEFLNSKDAANAIIAAGAFDFQNVRDYRGNNLVYPIVTIGEIKSKGAVFAESAIAGPVQKIEFVGAIARNGLTVGGEDQIPAGVKILDEAYGLEIGPQADAPASVFQTLIFDGAIETNGIGSGAFAGFDKLETVTFGGLLSELAVASGAFEESGKVTNGLIGSKGKEFVKYTVTDIANWAVNPFATDAFADAADVEEGEDAGTPRIIWWSIENEKLRNEILGAIQKAIYGDDYEGTVYSTRFNVFKWVDIAYVAPPVPEEEYPYFLFFQDNSENGNNKIAWGRYDLGSFTKEKGKYYTPNLDVDDPNYVAPYEAVDMVIPRIQETTGAKVKLTLYGLYYDEDDLGRVSTTYLVPLRVVSGTYQIPQGNDHLIIGKAEIQGNGTFSDKDVKIYFNNDVDGDEPDVVPAWSDDPEDATVTVPYDNANSAVWDQLWMEERVYSKAIEDDAKTHQELWDMVTRYGQDAPLGRAGKNLWVMTDPAKYKGFRVDSNPITKDNYTFIGVDWYYALLKNYNEAEAPARVIWLDEAQATAIFGVKGVNVKEALRNGAIYNMQGIRVDGTQKGIYIQNGKKFVVK